MLNLRTTAATVKFRAALPKWMEPKGQAFIEIDARPAGRINSAFMAAREEMTLAHMLRPEAVTDAEKLIAAQAYGRDAMAAIYDTCVLSWRTNLIDDGTGATLTCDRETFLALADVRIAEVSDALRAFVEQAVAAGDRVIEETEAATKN